MCKDEGVRYNTTIEKLMNLKSSFRKNGFTTSGNSSQISDGAAGVLLMKRKNALKLGLKIKGKIITYSVVGMPSEMNGIGPAKAIPKALKFSNLSIEDISVFEINEAFAGQCYYCMKFLGIKLNQLNPCGGAIALGHPLACTGSRQISTLLNELKRRRDRYGCISMCIATGMGAAAIIENESFN